MSSSILLERTLHLARNRPRSLKYDVIVLETGLKRRWLEEFIAGRIDDPSVVKVEKLYNYLAETPLMIAE